MKEIRECTIDDLSTLQEIGRQTFYETFNHLNTPENMENYLQKSFNFSQLEKRLTNLSSKFHFVFQKEELAGNLIINVYDAQTDNIDLEALEIERIYIGKSFKVRNRKGAYIKGIRAGKKSK